MSHNSTWRKLTRDLPAGCATYALLDCAATAGFEHNEEIYTRLKKPDVEKHCLFTGENAWMLDHAAPYLVALDSQPALKAWIAEHCLDPGWAVLLAAGHDIQAVAAHFRSLFALTAENKRKVYFRFYDPVILDQLLPLPDPQQALAVFGPVRRFVIIDPHGRPKAFDRPPGRPTTDLDPAYVIMANRSRFSDQWNRRLLEQHAQTYRRLGLQAATVPSALTLTDTAGTTVKLQKTAAGVTVTTGQGRVFDYTLTSCKHPARVVDPAGRAIDFDIQQRTNQPEPQPGENLLHAIRMDNNRLAWIFEYDDLDHLQRIDYPDGTHAGIAHDNYGHLAAWTDRNGHVTRYARDFDQRLTRITHADGNRTEFGYDGLSAPAAIRFADGTGFNFEYTDAGALKTFLAGNTRVADFQADSGNFHVRYADGTSAQFTVKNDKIIRAANQAGTVELTYDENGRLASETFAGRTVSYHRDAAGRLTGLTSPLAGRINYHRDKEDRVSAIEAWGQTINVAYAPGGAFESIAYPNGTRLDQTTTALGLPARLRLSTTGGRHIFERHYRRDRLGRVTRISDGEKHTAYTYDRQGRLLGVESTIAELNEDFTLDARANRLADKHSHYQLNAADKLVQSGPHGFTHDPMGNLTAGTCPRGTAAYTYCSLNRLACAQHPGGRTRYVYDAFGRRVEKITAKGRTRFIWAGNQLLHEIQLTAPSALQPADSAHTTAVDYLFFPQRPVLLALRHHGQSPLWAAFGHRYEVLCLTDSAGRPVWQAEYDAFGTAHIERGAERFQPLRLPGQYLDAETGLHYNQARYYHPGLGRYLSPDPLFLEGGSDNFYTYCNADPVNHIDPAGEFIFMPILIGAVLGAAISGGFEAWRQHKTGGITDGFAVAKAALLGGAIGAIGGGVSAAAEAALATVASGTALANSTLAGMGAAGFLSGTAGSVAEQCAESRFAGQGLDPLAVTQQALTDGVIGAVLGMAFFGSLSFAAKKLRKPASAFRPKLPVERPATVLAKARRKARNLTSRIKSAASRKNGRSNAFCVADPVNPVTGEVVLEQTDFTLTGRIPLPWTRHYGSQSDYSGLLGPGWQCPADARLQLDTDGLVTFFDEE